jgi:hypothetical protein
MSVEFGEWSFDLNSRVKTECRTNQAIGGRKMREEKEKAVESGVGGNRRSVTAGNR